MIVLASFVFLYPLVRTVQQRGTCVETRFPAEVGRALELEAQKLAVRIATAIGAVGILAVAFVVVVSLIRRPGESRPDLDGGGEQPYPLPEPVPALG